jgi:uncharacterized metal-binding protein
MNTMGCCNGKIEEKTKIVYGCAGCSDVGEISDLICRQLRKEGYAQPTASCLAGIGAGIQTFIDAAKSVEEVITVDGCGMACARKIVEHINITLKSYILTDMGLEKGKSQVTDDLVSEMAEKIKNN